MSLLSSVNILQLQTSLHLQELINTGIRITARESLMLRLSARTLARTQAREQQEQSDLQESIHQREIKLRSFELIDTNCHAKFALFHIVE